MAAITSQDGKKSTHAVASIEIEQEYFSLHEVAQITGKSYKAVHRAVQAGALAAAYYRRRWCVHYTAIHEWLTPAGARLTGRRSTLAAPTHAERLRLETIEARVGRIGDDLTALSASVGTVAAQLARLIAAVERITPAAPPDVRRRT